MYGTVARVKVKPGGFDAAVKLMQEWDRDLRPKVDGAEGGYLFKLDKDPNQAIIVAVFRDKEAYLANAENPEQDKWFRRFSEHLDGDPEWNDGEIVYGSS